MVCLHPGDPHQKGQHQKQTEDRRTPDRLVHPPEGRPNRPGRSALPRLWRSSQPFFMRASLVRRDDRLGPVPGAGLGEERGDVRLDRLRADPEALAHRVVGQPGGHQPQYVGLAVGEPGDRRARRCGGRPACAAARERTAAGKSSESPARHEADGLTSSSAAGPLEEEAGGAGAQRVVDVGVVLEGGDDDDAGRLGHRARGTARWPGCRRSPACARPSARRPGEARGPRTRPRRRWRPRRRPSRSGSASRMTRSAVRTIRSSSATTMRSGARPAAGRPRAVAARRRGLRQPRRRHRASWPARPSGSRAAAASAVVRARPRRRRRAAGPFGDAAQPPAAAGGGCRPVRASPVTVFSSHDLQLSVRRVPFRPAVVPAPGPRAAARCSAPPARSGTPRGRRSPEAPPVAAVPGPDAR